MNATFKNVINLANELIGKDKNPVKNAGGAIPAGHAILDKSAQSALDGLKFDPKAMMTDAKGRMAEFWAKLSPATKQTLLNSAIGALVGGGAGGAAGGYFAEPGHGLSESISKALLGGAMGGAAAGLGTAAYQSATSGRVLPGEQRGLAPVDRMANTVVGGMVHNPMLTLGGGAGAYGAFRGAENIAEAVQGDNRIGRVVRNYMAAHPGQAWNDSRLAAMIRQPEHIMRMLANNRRFMHGSIGMLGLPAGVGLGWLTDRYLQGRND